MQPFTLLIKPSGSDCNVDCTYCFYKSRAPQVGTGRQRMSDEVLEKLIKDYLGLRFQMSGFAWQGGEPTLMGLDFYRRAVELQKKYGVAGQEVGNSLQTNALLLDDAGWCRFLHANRFLVGISIDGPRELHDHYRLDLGGHGTWERVMRAIDRCKEYKVEFNTLTLINHLTADHPDEVFDFLIGLGVRYLQFIPCVELEPQATGAGGQLLTHDGPVKSQELTPKTSRETSETERTGGSLKAAGLGDGGTTETQSHLPASPPCVEGVPSSKRGQDARDTTAVRPGLGTVGPQCGRASELEAAARRVAEFSVTPKQYGDFLCRIFDRWTQFGLQRLSIRDFDSILGHCLTGHHTICTFDRQCSQYLVIEHTGDVFPCDFFVEPHRRLGNIFETPLDQLAAGAQKKAFARAKQSLADKCLICRYLALCRGGCTKDRVTTAPGGGTTPSYFCESYRQFFDYALPRFQQLAAQIRTGALVRPPQLA
jgi:anaerobic sulfatase-maturating enzyme